VDGASPPSSVNAARADALAMPPPARSDANMASSTSSSAVVSEVSAALWAEYTRLVLIIVYLLFL